MRSWSAKSTPESSPIADLLQTKSGKVLEKSAFPLEWHSRGQRFDPAYLHQEEKPGDLEKSRLPGFFRPFATILRRTAKNGGISRYYRTITEGFSMRKAAHRAAFFHFFAFFEDLSVKSRS